MANPADQLLSREDPLNFELSLMDEILPPMYSYRENGS